MGVARVIGLLLAALFLAGCQARLGVTIEVEADGSGSLAVALAADPALRAEIAGAGADPLSDLAETGRTLGETWEVTDTVAADGSREVRLSTQFADPDELTAVTAALADALNAPEVALLQPFTLTVERDRLMLEGGAGLAFTPAVAEVGLTPEEAAALLGEHDALAYTVEVRVPDEVIEHNAHRVDGQMLLWRVTPGETVAIRVVGARPRPWWPLAAAVVAGLVAAVLVVCHLSRRIRGDK